MSAKWHFVILISVVGFCPQEVFLADQTPALSEDPEARKEEYFCGRRKLAYCTHASGHIHEHFSPVGGSVRTYGGQDAYYGEYPWVIAIVRKTSKQRPVCLATLISNTRALSIFECVKSDLDDFLLQFGQYNLEAENEPITVVERTITDISKMPEPTIHHNAVIVVKFDSVDYSYTVSPICLPTRDSPSLVGNFVMCAGWGVKTNGPTTNLMKEVSSPVIDFDNCQDQFANAGHPEVKPNIKKEHLCTYDQGSDNPICSADVGGPVMHRLANHTWVLDGIMSGICTCEKDGDNTWPGAFFRMSVEVLNMINSNP